MLRTLDAPKGCSCLAYSPKQNLLAVGDGNGIKLFDVRTWEIVRELVDLSNNMGYTGEHLTHAAFACVKAPCSLSSRSGPAMNFKEGELLLTRGGDEAVNVSDVTSDARCTLAYYFVSQTPYLAAATMPNGLARVCTRSGASTASFWNLQTGAEIGVAESKTAWDASFCAQDPELALLVESPSAYVHRATTRVAQLVPDKRSNGSCSCGRFLPSNGSSGDTYMVAVANGCDVLLFRVPAEATLSDYEPAPEGAHKQPEDGDSARWHTFFVQYFKCNAPRSKLSLLEGTEEQWCAALMRERELDTTKYKGDYKNIYYKLQGKYGQFGAPVANETLKRLQPWRILTGHQECIQVLAVRPSGGVLASGDAASSIRVWNIEADEDKDGQVMPAAVLKHDGTAIKGEYNPARMGVQALLFLQDPGELLVSGGQDDTAKIWDMSSVVGPTLVVEEEAGHDIGLQCFCGP